MKRGAQKNAKPHYNPEMQNAPHLARALLVYSSGLCVGLIRSVDAMGERFQPLFLRDVQAVGFVSDKSSLRIERKAARRCLRVFERDDLVSVLVRQQLPQ